MIPFLPVYFCLIDIALSQGSMVWVGGLEGERGSGEADQGEHNLALPRIVQSGPEHLKILKINLGQNTLEDGPAEIHLCLQDYPIDVCYCFHIFLNLLYKSNSW